MFGKRLAGKLAAALLAGIMVIGCGATVLADEKIVDVEERDLYFRQYVPTQTVEFIPECTGEYIFQSVAPMPTTSRFVDPLIEVKQNGNSWVDFNSADGLNFKIRVHLEGGVPCRIFVQCDGYYNTAIVTLFISRVENEPAAEETDGGREVRELTEDQIIAAKNFLKEIALVRYADDGITEEDIDEVLNELTVEEIIEYCEELGYTF